MTLPNPFMTILEQEIVSLFPRANVQQDNLDQNLNLRGLKAITDEVFRGMDRLRNQKETAPFTAPVPAPRTDPNAAPPAIRDPRFRPSVPLPGAREIQTEKGSSADVKLAQADTGTLSDADSARQSFFEGMVRRGMPPIAAAGFTGSVEQESRFDPLAEGDKDPKTGETRSFGVLQLQGPRREAFLEFAKAENKDPNNIETQLDFAIVEMFTTEKRAAMAMFGAETVEEATLAANKFFRASNPMDANRLRNALRVNMGAATAASVKPARPPRPPAPSPSDPSADRPVTRPQPQRPVTRTPLRPVPIIGPPTLAQHTGTPNRSAVPVAWQQAAIKFIQSRDPKDLSVVPRGSLPVLLLLMGQDRRTA